MRARIALLAVVAFAAWPLWVNAQRDAKPHAIVFDGSSSIEYWDLKSSFPDLDVINEGIGGTEITDSLKTEEKNVIAHRPHTVVFYSGDNDIGGGVAPKEVAAHFDQYASKLHAALPQVKLVVISINWPAGRLRSRCAKRTRSFNSTSRRALDRVRRHPGPDARLRR